MNRGNQKTVTEKVSVECSPDKISSAVETMRRKGYQITGSTPAKYVAGQGMKVSVNCEK